MLSGIDEITGVGDVEYAYNFGVDPGNLTGDFGQHAFIEHVIKNYATVFGSNLSGDTVQWAPSCGNDELFLQVDILSGPPNDPVPEPASLVIWSLLGGLGIAVGCYRRRKRA